MKLVLTQPSPWPVHGLDEGPADTTADPSILIGPLELAVLSEWRPWMERVVAFERPAFTLAEIVRHSTIHSTLRWKVEIVESRISDGPEVLERRLSYLYSVLDWWGAVMFRASPARFETEVQRALPVLASARPDWEAGVVSLADLYRG